MNAMTRVFALRICDESTAIRATMALCHAASVLVLVAALFGIARFCTTPGEILIGTLAAAATSLCLATSGLVLGLLAEVRKG